MSANQNFDIIQGPSAPQAPAMLTFDARAVADWTMKCEWAFGDAPEQRSDPRHLLDAQYPATVDANTVMQGLVAAHIFNSPGNYSVTLKVTTLDGKVTPFRRTVTIGANCRTITPVLGMDSTSFAALASKPNQHIQIAAAPVIQVASTITVGSGTIIECLRGRAGIFCPSGGPAFVGTPGSHDIILRGLSFDSPCKLTADSYGYPYWECQQAEGVKIRGTNFAVVDCDLRTLNRGIEIPDMNSNGTLIQGIRQIDLCGIESQPISAWGGQRLVVAFCNLLNSYAESPIRFDSGAGDGASVLYNYFSQDIDATKNRGTAKAAFTGRSLKDYLFAFNAIENAECSFNEGNPSTHVLNGTVKMNALRSPKAPGRFHISSSVDGMILRNNDIGPTGAEDISVSVDNTQPIQNVTIKDNGNVKLKKYHDGPGRIVNLSCDAKTTLIN